MPRDPELDELPADRSADCSAEPAVEPERTDPFLVALGWATLAACALGCLLAACAPDLFTLQW